jgi:hypothetical protein
MKNQLPLKLAEPFLFRIYEDVSEMAKYAVDDGKKLDENIMSKLSPIVNKATDIYCEIVKIIDSEINGNAQDLSKLYKSFCEALKDDTIDLINIHKHLSEVVAPATPGTIKFTKPTVNFPFTKAINTIPFIRNLMVSCIICLLLFVITLILTNIPDKNIQGKILGFELRSVIYFFGPQVSDMIKLLLSSALGSYFYSIYTANKYFVSRTFDKKYVTFYNNRIIIGIIAGFILSYIINFNILNCQVTKEILSDGRTIEHYPNKDIISQLPKILLALLGGFSADGVIRILNRIVAMLIALVQGETKDILQEKEQYWKNKLESENTKYKLDNYKQLLEFYNKNKDNLTGDFKTGLDKLMQDLNK